MFGMLKKKLGSATAEVHKIENRDLMEAIVAGSILIAAADGNIDESEMMTLEKLISSNDSLTHFGAEISKTMGKFESMMDAGPRIGKMKVLKEIADIKNNPEEAEEVFLTMVTIAEADGEIDDKEMAILKEVGMKLGVRLSDYGLE